ncbi:MAG TPA: DUF1841 family protein [Gammaproteobacteria bacterium]|nr:DUF1841 family protein [Gammaproteobacteria bacterium]
MPDSLIQDRDTSRQFFLDVWHKYRNRQSLQPLEKVILEVILEHPEYHHLLEDPDALQREFSPDSGQTNPFLHMGMHITIREQASIDRPAGIAAIYQQIVNKAGSPYAAEHEMLECLGESLWLAQRHNTLPDESRYLECLQRLVKTSVNKS